MDGRCPFCWSFNVGRVALLTGRLGAPHSRLMECRECERWFRADSGEEIPKLFEICSTRITNPNLCPEDVRQFAKSGGNGFQRWRAAEFNQLCSDCLQANFVADRLCIRA